jgi:hypothetical protein
VLDEVQQLQGDMDDISGQHEISRGTNPPQVTAATALSYLQEQDDTKLSTSIESIEDAVEKIGRLVLSYVSQFWDTGRLIKVVGKDGSFDAQVYKGADLGGNHDLKVEAGSALPTSKAAKQAFLMDLMKLGFVQPDKGLELLEIGGIERLYEDLYVDIRQAQRENIRMEETTPVAVNDWDNHQVHIEVHNKYRKSQEYEALDDDARVLFQNHVQTHQALLGQAEPPGNDPNLQPIPDPQLGMAGPEPAGPGNLGPTQPSQGA